MASSSKPHAAPSWAQGSSDLIDLVYRINRHRSLDGVPAATIEQARRLGWIGAHPDVDAAGLSGGRSVARVPVLARARAAAAAEREYTLLSRESYRGKSVLEVGCGFGAQLFTLDGLECRFVGVEPVALHRQFTLLLAEREGITPPEAWLAAAQLTVRGDLFRRLDQKTCFIAERTTTQ